MQNFPDAGSPWWSRRSLVAGAGMRAFRELLTTVVMATLVFILVQGTVRNYRVEGFSMDNSFHNGQLVLVSKLSYARPGVKGISKVLPFLDRDKDGVMEPFGAPMRGDVVVFYSVEQSGRFLVKRVIGLPGDSVEIRKGVIYSNGKPVDERSYIDNPGVYTMSATTIPSGSYWVMGDNRTASSDSRTWGFLPRKNLVGKAWVSYWPLDRLGWVRAPRF